MKSDFNFWSASTADSARVEVANQDIQVGGKRHLIKASHAVNSLNNILIKESLTSHEQMIAENIRLDLLDSLGDKLWYSQTNIPKI